VLGATYWLHGAAEFGYADELDRILSEVRCRVIHHPTLCLPDLADRYAAADAVVFPSTWEGFGNPPIEAAIFRRPVAVGPYPVGAELRRLGFRWFDADDAEGLRTFLARPDAELLDHNRRLAVERFSLPVMTERIRALLDDAGWLP
jgi:glycosyltransferase involved in cell wall biosynthesis